LTCGPTEGKYIYDCAKDCLENEEYVFFRSEPLVDASLTMSPFDIAMSSCDATVSFEGYCYPKTLDYFQVSYTCALCSEPK
jgi:hypothetical protein